MKPSPLIRPRPDGFTLLEVMLAILIFSLVISAIYSIWLFIIKGSKLGLDAAMATQRSRITMRALEDAFTTSAMYTANIKDYLFFADTSGDMAQLSLVSRLPSTFPGVGRYDAVVRRVSFWVQPGPQGNELIMTQAPLLQETNEVDGYSLVLARDVTLFRMEFWDLQKGEWLEEWGDTNQMPRMVRVALGLGQSPQHPSDPRDLTVRLIVIPSAAVPGNLQVPGGVPLPTGSGLMPGPPGNMPTPGQSPGRSSTRRGVRTR